MAEKIEINAMGDACPIPVVKTMKALKALGGAGTVVTSVDNQTAVKNVTRMATGKGCAVSTEQVGDKEWRLTITADKAVDVAEGEPESATCEVEPTGKFVVQVSSEVMGVGDDALGHKLMKSFFYALTQLDELPQTILLYNGGAHLTCEGSSCLDDIKGLADQGVEVLTCGTCLDHYGITDTLAVGEVTNMYVIAQKLSDASRVVRP